jgi:Nucleoside 2-deoxyribosyltransferase like
MGRAENWQSAVALALSDEDVVILNPRREDWDASWRQSMDEPRFVEQVEWELAAQERAAVIAMYFAPSTQAPISLLELGLAARSGKLLVCCPEGYWRKGNVDVVCRRYGVPLLKDLPALIGEVKRVMAQ